MREGERWRPRCPDCGGWLPPKGGECPLCGSATEPDWAGQDSPTERSEPDSDTPENSETCETDPPSERPAHWVSVRDCLDELEALTLQAELVGHGIPSIVRSLEVPGYRGLMGMGPPCWGRLLVDRADALRAGWLIRQFFDSLSKEEEPGRDGLEGGSDA